jgi:peptidyl-prolyl cis-trans isomerase B (cyclophilin B)
MQAIIHTTKGPIRLSLHADKVPFTVANFATLAKNGFYDNIPFHRVIEEFMIQ